MRPRVEELRGYKSFQVEALRQKGASHDLQRHLSIGYGNCGQFQVLSLIGGFEFDFQSGAEILNIDI